MAGWQPEDNLQAVQSNLDFGVHLVQISNADTLIVYSGAGLDVEKGLADTKISLTDDQAGNYPLKAVIPLAIYKELQFGALLFQGHKPGARMLALQIQSSNDNEPVTLPIARAYGPDQELEHIGGVTTLFRDGYIQQSKTRISNNGMGLFKGDRMGESLSEQGRSMQDIIDETATEAARSAQEQKATPTPVAADPQVEELTGGEKIDMDATIRIEDLDSNQVMFLYIFITTEGELKGRLIE